MQAHLLLGEIRLGQGMAKLASRHFAAAGSLDPTNTAPTDRLRMLTRPAPSSVLAALPFAALVAMLLAPAGLWAAIAGLLIALPVGIVGLQWARRLRSKELPIHLVPEARRVLEADNRLNNRGSR